MATFPGDRPFAAECDAADPLASFRERFARDDPSLIYLGGNSLGMLPLVTAERVAGEVCRELGAGLVRSCEHWIACPAAPGTCSAPDSWAPPPDGGWSAIPPRSTCRSRPVPPWTAAPAGRS